jgi:transcriptional regulator with XRE-family HTH domain
MGTGLPTAVTLELPQAEVAERMGVTKSQVSQIERGEVSTVATPHGRPDNRHGP